MQAAEVASDERHLRKLIARNRVFDAALKRAWLRVLPHMPEAQRRELADILRLEATVDQPEHPDSSAARR